MMNLDAAEYGSASASENHQGIGDIASAVAAAEQRRWEAAEASTRMQAAFLMTASLNQWRRMHLRAALSSWMRFVDAHGRRAKRCAALGRALIQVLLRRQLRLRNRAWVLWVSRAAAQAAGASVERAVDLKLADLRAQDRASMKREIELMDGRHAAGARYLRQQATKQIRQVSQSVSQSVNFSLFFSLFNCCNYFL